MAGDLLASAWSEDDILKCVICYGELADAVLLKCLHSACRSCTAGDVTASVTCPKCQVSTDAPMQRANLLISSLAHRSLVLKDVFSCAQCIDEEKADATAVAWCYTCQHSLCVDCLTFQSRLHSTHKVIKLDEQTSLVELYHPPLRACTKHYEELKFACFTCNDGRCCKCAHGCYVSSHDILPIDSPEALKRMKDVIVEAATLQSDLNSAVALLQAHLNLPEKVAIARRESLAVLQKAKKTAINSICNAYENAVDSLLECWDTLEVKSLGLQESAERIRTRIDWTNTYCRLALNSDDLAALLPQLDAMFLSLRACLEETKGFKEPIDPLKLIKVNVRLPADLDSIATDWFGLSSLLADDFNCSVDKLPVKDSIDYYTRKASTLKELEKLLESLKEQQEIRQSEPQAMERRQSEVELQHHTLASWSSDPHLLQQQQQSYSFDATSLRVHLSFECCDVALSQGGCRMLLAASERGLMEFCSETGRELSCWLPPKLRNGQDDSVQGVAALNDGQAAVGIFRAQLVVLLRQSKTRGSDGAAEGGVWTEDRRFEQLPWPPRRLSAHEDVLAVTNDQWNENQKRWVPGSRLQFMSVSGRRLGAELQREYSIRSLAVAARVVVTGSLGKVKLSGGRRDARVLDAHSLSDGDERLWRYELSSNFSDEVTYGVCADSSSGCLYTTVLRSDLSSGRVSALSLADGSELRRIALGFDGNLLPVLLSLSDDTSVGQAEQPSLTCSSCRQTLLLAALCWDPKTKQQRTVTLHRSHRE